MKASNSRYRPEIDGLRSIAVLSVLCYHLELSLDIIVLADNGSTWFPKNKKYMSAIKSNLQTLIEFNPDIPVVIYGERPFYKKAVYKLVLKYGRLVGADRYTTPFLMHGDLQKMLS